MEELSENDARALLQMEALAALDYLVYGAESDSRFEFEVRDNKLKVYEWSDDGEVKKFIGYFDMFFIKTNDGA